MAIVFLSGGARASGQPEARHGEVIDRPSQTTGAYLSPVFETDFTFGLAGVAWQGGAPNDFSLRYRTDGSWSQWFSPESMDAVRQGDWQYSIEPILANQADAVQYRVTIRETAPVVKLIYVDTSGKASVSVFNFLKKIVSPASAQSAFTIASRAQWQADENWRKNSSGADTWPAEYVWPKKFVIHHTAGNDGGTDPAATVRGIYYWHAIVLGWGDIGYNYLIDQAGNIYEGRYGGDGVVAAHVYRDAACATQRFGGAQYEANFNRGTIGISILGDYETTVTLNDKVKNALTDLIAQKGLSQEISPSGSGYLIDADYPNIVGHRDLDCTTCPGGNLYGQISVIRTEAQTKYDALAAAAVTPVYKTSYVGQSENPVAVKSNTDKQVWVDFRNDGNTTWRNYIAAPIQLIAKNASSSLRAAGWQSETIVTNLTTANVAPGEVGRFSFTIKGPTDQLEVMDNFQLQINNQPVEGGDFSLAALVTDLPFAADLVQQKIAPAVFAKQHFTTTLQFKNMGTEAWKRGDVKLVIEDLGGAVSRFLDASWPGRLGNINFSESEVPPGAVANYSVRMLSPANPGKYLNNYRLTGKQEIIMSPVYSITRVDSPWQAAFVEHNIPPAVMNVWRFGAVVRFKNIGITTWDRSIVLKAYDLGDAVSRFHDTSWVSNFTAARLKEQSVKPGGTGTFEFRFRSPAEPGVYFNRFVLDRNGSAVQSGTFTLLTRVDKR
ncbi:MAG: NBR1-Ig-like domain-containing protein [Patescibacteria group bacterium]